MAERSTAVSALLRKLPRLLSKALATSVLASLPDSTSLTDARLALPSSLSLPRKAVMSASLIDPITVIVRYSPAWASDSRCRAVEMVS